MKRTKKIAGLLLSAVLLMSSLAACGSKSDAVDYPEDFQAFLDSLDTDFSYEVDKTISEFGDDPVLGFRSAGSPAEKETAAYIEDTMKEIGLQNVTVDKIDLDGWTFKGANITFKNADGEEQKIDLGGYQTTIQAEDEAVKVVYLNKGTAKDYEGVDVTGKLVLIDIDQNNEWWINNPAYQAHVKGAKAVLANSAMEVEKDDRIGTQDFCGPDDAPALGISQQDTDALKEAIEASGNGEIEVVLNADSVVTEDVQSQNVWGEIPGKTDEVIYMMAHMDGYFHSFYDDASGVGLILGCAKAMLDSGYEPDKTIRFVCHGAEEWGKNDSQADWAIGAYKQITEVHPEWAEDAFAIVNIDGAYSIAGETTFGISTAEELYNYIDSVAAPMLEASDYEYRYQMPPSTYKEDFNYMSCGVPSVATAKGEETVFYDTAYHTSYDSDEAMELDQDTWLWMHTLYARFVYAFDDLAARPMDFGTRFEALKESIDEDAITDTELTEKIDAAIEAAAPVTEKINNLNAEYAEAVEADNTEAAADIREEAMALNLELHKVYKQVQDELLYLDGELSVVFPNETRQANVQNLDGAIAALKDGDAETAYGDYLSGINNGWNAMFFDKETVDHFNNRWLEGLKGTWAEGKVDPMDCYVDEIVRSLMDKAEAGDTDFAAEIAELEKLQKEQTELLNNVVEDEKDGLDTITKMLNGLV